MKIIIDHDGVKRQIEGVFGVCGNGNDLKRLAYLIEQRLRDTPDEGRNFFGWIEIFDSVPMTANTTPGPWKDLSASSFEPRTCAGSVHIWSTTHGGNSCVCGKYGTIPSS